MGIMARLAQIQAKQAPHQAPWPVPSTFHNIMVFIICIMGMWILNKWLGQVDPRRPINYAFSSIPELATAACF